MEGGISGDEAGRRDRSRDINQIPARRREVSDVIVSSAVHQDNFAYHASLSQQLVRLSGFRKGKSLSDQWLDFALTKEIE